jgi:hypothetical protein
MAFKEQRDDRSDGITDPLFAVLSTGAGLAF